MMSETKAPKDKKPTRRKSTDKAQFQRFVEAARQIGVEEAPEALDRAFQRVMRQRKPND